MKTIWKFPFAVRDEVEILMPTGARVLGVQVQHGEPCLWAEVQADSPKERRTFNVYGTGHPLPESPGDYVGTFQVYGGDLVFHVYAI